MPKFESIQYSVEYPRNLVEVAGFVDMLRYDQSLVVQHVGDRVVLRNTKENPLAPVVDRWRSMGFTVRMLGTWES